MKLIGKAEADVVVAVAGRVVVTVSNATVVCVVVPAATAQQTVRALWVNFPEQMYVLFIGLGLTLQCPAGRLEVVAVKSPDRVSNPVRAKVQKINI